MRKATMAACCLVLTALSAGLCLMETTLSVRAEDCQNELPKCSMRLMPVGIGVWRMICLEVNEFCGEPGCLGYFSSFPTVTYWSCTCGGQAGDPETVKCTSWVVDEDEGGISLYCDPNPLAQQQCDGNTRCCPKVADDGDLFCCCLTPVNGLCP